VTGQPDKTSSALDAVDAPDSFDLTGHLNSPVERLAITNGFVKDSTSAHEICLIKRLTSGREARLYGREDSRENPPATDPSKPEVDKGRMWEMVLSKTTHRCTHCHMQRSTKRGRCPHCHENVPVRPAVAYDRLAYANETVMYYLLSAFVQRGATWPEGVPKSALLSTDEALENTGVDDPSQFMQKLAAAPEHELIELSEHPPTCTFACVCGRFNTSGLAFSEQDRITLRSLAQQEFERHISMTSASAFPTSLETRNLMLRRRKRTQAESEDVDRPVNLAGALGGNYTPHYWLVASNAKGDRLYYCRDAYGTVTWSSTSEKAYPFTSVEAARRQIKLFVTLASRFTLPDAHYDIVLADMQKEGAGRCVDRLLETAEVDDPKATLDRHTQLFSICYASDRQIFYLKDKVDAHWVWTSDAQAASRYTIAQAEARLKSLVAEMHSRYAAFEEKMVERYRIVPVNTVEQGAYPC